MTPHSLKKVKFATAALFASLIVFLYVATPIGQLFTADGVQALRLWMAHQGAWASLLYVALYTLATVLCLPGSLLSLAAGPLFGTALGIVYVVVASNLGANLCFLLARYLGRDFVEGFLGKRKWSLPEGTFRGTGLWWVFGLRLIPAVPFNVLNYAAGLTPLSLRDHAVGSFFGMLPGTIIYVALGTAFSRIRFNDPQTWKHPEVGGALALALLFTLGLALWKKYSGNQR